MKIGYARVSTNEQSLDRQLDQLTAEGCERIYEEKMTGTRKDRPELTRMMDSIREGDIIVVTELTRLGRSVKDLFALVDLISKSGANLKSLKEPWMDTTTPQGKLLFTMFAGISEFEAELIRQRTMEGLSAARARGRKGGRPAVPADKVDLAIRMYDSKTCSVAEIVKTTGVSRSTLYSALEKRKI